MTPDAASSPHASASSHASEASSGTAPEAESDRYHRARRDFDDLPFEKQATFLLESSVTALARGIEEAGRMLVEGLEDVMQERRRTRPSAGGASDSSDAKGPRPGAAEPETGQQRRTRDAD